MQSLIPVLGISLISQCSLINNDSELGISDSSSLNYVAIYGSDTVELSKTDTGWTLNDRYDPDPIAIKNFFYAFENIDIAGATLGSAVDSMISRQIILRGKRINRIYRFYSSDDYYLMHHEGSSKIYRIRILSAEDADLSTVFSDDPSHWRDKLLFSTESRKIDYLRVVPASSEYEGFAMKREGGGLKLSYLDGKLVDSTRIDNEKMILYPSYIEEIYFQREITEDSIIQRISVSYPFYRFLFKNIGEEAREFEVYPLYSREGKEDLFYGAVLSVKDSSLFKINFANIDLLFQTIDYFTVE